VKRHGALILSLSLALLARPALAHGGHDDEFQSVDQGGTEASIQVTPETQRTLGLRVAPVTIRTLSQSLQTTGRIEAIPALTTSINAPLAGRLLQVYVHQGEQVKVGQPLASLDSPEIRQLQVTAQQQKSQLSAEQMRLQAQLALAQANYRREQELYAAKISAQKELQLAQAEYISAQANLRAVQSQLLLINAPLQARLAQLGGMDRDGSILLRAPQSGYIATQNVVSGEAVEPGKTLLNLVNTRQVWAVADVYEKDNNQVHLGQRVRVSVPSQTHSGSITVIDPVVNSETRTLKVRAILANPRGELKPGMFASIQLLQGQTIPMMTIPQRAVLEVEGKAMVYVKNGTTFIPTEIELGPKDGDWVAVTDGLFEGDEVVTDRVFQLRAQSLKSRGKNLGEGETAEVSMGKANENQFPLWSWLAAGLALIGAFAAGMGVARWKIMEELRFPKKSPDL